MNFQKALFTKRFVRKKVALDKSASAPPLKGRTMYLLKWSPVIAPIDRFPFNKNRRRLGKKWLYGTTGVPACGWQARMPALPILPLIPPYEGGRMIVQLSCLGPFVSGEPLRGAQRFTNPLRLPLLDKAFHKGERCYYLYQYFKSWSITTCCYP